MTRMQDSSSESMARVAIVRALQRLVLERPFEQISVGTIVAAADVGRSTFYEHFGCKEDVLRISLSPVTTVLAETVTSDRVTQHLLDILDHLLEQASLVQAYLRGSLSPIVVDCLAVEIDRLLQERSTATCDGIPRQMLAAQTAETIFGLIRSWVSHHPNVSTVALADHLLRTVQSVSTGQRENPA